MSKIRLNADHRNMLRCLARELVSCPAELFEEGRTYAAASATVRRVVEKALPPADMRILKKYEKAAVDDRVMVRLTAGGVETLCFAKGTGPLATGHRIFLADEETTTAVTAYKTAEDAHSKAVKSKLDDYYSLINNSRHFEDVVAVWPEAERLRSQFGGAALITLSPDIVARIQQDVAARAAA